MMDFGILKVQQKPETSLPKQSWGSKLSRLRNSVKAKKTLSIIAIIAVAFMPSYYFYHKSQQAEARINDPNTANKQVIDEVVKKVSNHVLLPTDEQPTLATVSDATKVKGQPFFRNASNGDKVLVFTQARKAYLYRPSTDLVIEVAPLNVDSTPSPLTNTK